jgi:hypothetical protein
MARRIIGWLAMALGALTMLVGAALMILMTANFVEWPNAADALGTTAMITLPVLGLGGVVLLFGRWLLGDWRTGRPLRAALPWALQIGGGLAALVYGAMLVNVVAQGFGPEDYAAAVKLLLATAAGALAVRTSGRLRAG